MLRSVESTLLLGTDSQTVWFFLAPQLLVVGVLAKRVLKRSTALTVAVLSAFASCALLWSNTHYVPWHKVAPGISTSARRPATHSPASSLAPHRSACCSTASPCPSKACASLSHWSSSPTFIWT